MRVIFAGGGTGGHLYPALAVARALVRINTDVRPHFIGATRGIERDILPQAGFPFTLLDLHPLYRARPWKNTQTAIGLVRGMRAMTALARDDRPRLIFATGGFASSAALVHGRLHGVPYVLQEANSFAGQTVRLFSRRAREIYLGFPEAAATLPAVARRRCVDTGNPIEPPPIEREARHGLLRRWELTVPESARVLLVFGGSQGSAALNQLMDGWIARGLPPGLAVIWGTGRDHFGHYASRASERIIVRPYLAPIAEAYAMADLALTRAGAMTTAELCAWGVPMILIPLPTAAADHQTANARTLADGGAARWIAQSEASVPVIDMMVRSLLDDRAQLAALADGARRRARPAAASDIAARVLRLLEIGQAT